MMTKFCNICGRLAAETETKRLVRDHNHKTGLIRGVLCDLCNGRLGTYESNKLRKRNKRYMYWLKRYELRIKEHLTTNTGIRYLGWRRSGVTA